MISMVCVLTMIGFLFAPLAYAVAEESITVVVKKGDVLIGIVEEYLEDPLQWKEVARINHLKNPNLIYPDQVLVIPVRLLRGTALDGMVSFVRGDAMMQAKGTEEWVPVGLQDRIKEGTTIKTGDACAVEIVFRDGSTCFQQANTLVDFLKVREKGGVSEEMLSLQRGRILTKILKATGREPRFEIQTPSAVCAARGTMFRTSVDLDGDTRSEVLEGKTDVLAMDQKEVVCAGEGTLVRKGEPPLKPRKLLPPPEIIRDKTLYRKLPLHLAFTTIEGAVSYRMLLSRDRDGKEIVFENRVRPGEPVAVESLDDGVYFLHALSIDEIALEGMPSVPEEIRVRVNPVPPSVTVPAEGAEYREKSISCSIQPVFDASAYQIQVAHDHLFQRIVEEQTFSGAACATKQLDFGTYYFRARSVAGDGYEGAWSDVIPFSVVEPPPGPAPEPVEKGSFVTFLGIVAALGLFFALLP